MTESNSFCFISTFNCSHELIGMLLSLSIHHNNSKVYGLVDSETENLIKNFIPKIQLQLFLKTSLDKYSNKNRNIMVQENIWDEFQMQKANVIKYALEYESDTIFLDSDILFLNPINCIDKTKELGLSPHYVKKSNTDEVGYYNGGCLWTKNKNVPNDWIEFTKTSRYHDQASIEDLAKKYSFQEFGKEVNFMPWRVLLANNSQEVINSININNNQLNIGDKPLVFLHTHFHDQRFIQVNNIFINALRKLKRYKELLIIDRIINKNWTIKIPKQPQQGIWRHNNDSFRELALLYKKNNNDVNIELIDNGHCMLGNHILLYDRPTHEWFNQDLANTSLILLGNGDINKEGKLLRENNLNVKPWIFWPRRPFIIEKFLENNKLKLYSERTIESIFIGNIENNVQNQYRNTNNNWENVLDVYHCTQGTQHKFSQQQYLEQLANAKYGLCMRGYGSKCHREVELMALGTVPIITESVSIDSYMDPPQENIHYIRCNNPENLKTILSNIRQEKWEFMSNNCYNWYQKNVHSKNSFNNFLNNILYS
tara:strand:+ start:41178 stop:42797 length:1620 start_codon:yes stop_codon:yes gene_type:complete